MDKKNRTGVLRPRIKEGIGINLDGPNGPIVDQLGDQIFGIPPNPLTALLTGLAGAVAGGISLLIFFYFWEPGYYISPDWLIFVALGGIAGLFLRFEQPLFREIYALKAQALQQARDTGGHMSVQIGFGHIGRNPAD